MGGGARLFLLVVLICLVDTFNERDGGLLHSVRYDSSFDHFAEGHCVSKYAFSASWDVFLLTQLQFFLKLNSAS